jgi:GH43 family beta-xylosidase
MHLYTNPVYDLSCPDPFVLKHRGAYWCYCTGWSHDGRCFGVLTSRDLIHWTQSAGALAPLEGAFKEYWAPEVVYWNGSFYMYYSVGDGVVMHIRAAVAEAPGGPFVDCGKRLTPHEFAIDAHCFQDEDGCRYLFYATDFLDRSRVGTGTVFDRMVDPLTLAGDPRPVALAHFDWQVFDPQRMEKGGVRWHTVEGPFVLKRKGVYYEMFSGGNWQNTSYGVSYASAGSLEDLAEWRQIEHNDRRPLVLRTLPGEVIGPGHNSVVRAPDNLQLYCVYHRWDTGSSARLLAIDPLEWIGDRLTVLGPSTGPEPAPNLPSISGFAAGWTWPLGSWRTSPDTAVCEPGFCQARLALPVSSFLLQVHLRVLPPSSQTQRYGIALASETGELATFVLAPFSQHAIIRAMDTEAALELHPDYLHEVDHLLQVEADGPNVSIALDGVRRWQGRLTGVPERLQLFAESCAAEFAAFELTLGWENLFEETDVDPQAIGWLRQPSNVANVHWSVADKQLRCGSGGSSMLAKRHGLSDYEVVVNSRLAEAPGKNATYGFCPVLDRGGNGLFFGIESAAAGAALAIRGIEDAAVLSPPLHVQALGSSFDPLQFHQFRFRKKGQTLQAYLESQPLTELHTAATTGWLGLFTNHAAAAFDLVRVTAISETDTKPELSEGYHG